jgi:replicative DNA helicase
MSQFHSQPAETAVLSIMLTNNQHIESALMKITEDDFFCEPYPALFAGIVLLYEQKGSVDTISLSAHLPGLRHEIESLWSVAVTKSFEQYVDIVLKYSQTRQLNQMLQEKGQSLNSQADPVALIGEIQDEVERIESRSFVHDVANSTAVMDSTFAYIKTAQESDGGLIGFSSGFDDLDSVLLGFQKKKFYVIAGRPAMGKTALAMNIADNMARLGFVPGVFSLEMGIEELGTRQIAGESRIPIPRILSLRMTGEEKDRLLKAKESIENRQMVVDDNAGTTPSAMFARMRTMVRKHGVNVIVIDHLQIIEKENFRINDYQHMSYLTRNLKRMAKELDIPVIALSQLSRSVESRDNKRPFLSDLRESGTIEQDADVVMFVYRDGYYNQRPDDQKAELILAKHRGGATGTVYLSFQGNISKFFPQKPLTQTGIDAKLKHKLDNNITDEVQVSQLF